MIYMTRTNIYTVDYQSLMNDCATFEIKNKRKPELHLNYKSIMGLLYKNYVYPYEMLGKKLTTFNSYKIVQNDELDFGEIVLK